MTTTSINDLFSQSPDLSFDGYGYDIDESDLADGSLDPATRKHGIHLENMADDAPGIEDVLCDIEVAVEFAGVDLELVEAIGILYAHMLFGELRGSSTGSVDPVVRKAGHIEVVSAGDCGKRPSLTELRVRLCRPEAPKPGVPKLQPVTTPAELVRPCRQDGCVAKVLTGRGYCVTHGGEARQKHEKTVEARRARFVPAPIAAPRRLGPGDLRVARHHRQ